jgi:1,4-alpha-glucan branching enzyme
MKSVLLALHAHLPYVRHPEWENFLEEQWLFEGVTETYAPLVLMLNGLRSEGVKAKLTLTLSPTLLLMLDDELLQKRTIRYVDSRLSLLEEEKSRHSSSGDAFRGLVDMYRERYVAIRELLNGRDGLIRGFRSLQDSGMLEIITCAATHAFLPHLQMSPGAIKRQVGVGCRVYERLLGCRPRGIWLPECGYIPGIETALRDEGIRYFFAESHAAELASPGKVIEPGGPLVPIATLAGVVAFARDRETSKAVWSAKEGYPGDFIYRDFYRDVGFDLPEEVVAPYMPPAVNHTFTGIKYFRITGVTDKKEPYDRRAALGTARVHAEDFVNRAIGRLWWIGECGMKSPLIVCPYDAELFGHWWFEGIDWLGEVFRRIAEVDKDLVAVSANDYLDSGGETRRATPAHSSWGDGGYGEVWGSDQAEWIYPHIYGLNHHFRRLSQRYSSINDPRAKRALAQFERELLLLESSDWPFILHTGTQTGYAKIRLAEHIRACLDLKGMLEKHVIEEGRLGELEWRHPSFTERDLWGT